MKYYPQSVLPSTRTVVLSYGSECEQPFKEDKACGSGGRCAGQGALMLTAIVRDVSRSIAQCELTHLARTPVDVEKARAQHAAYVWCLEELGCAIHRLPVEDALPDAVFVEDTAVVLDEAAVIARPGAPSRRAEVPSVERALEHRRKLLRIEPPDTLDGGDVLSIGRTLYVGLTRRTGPGAVAQLERMLKPLGYAVRGVEVSGCLHLKSAASFIGDHRVLCNSKWVDPGVFEGMEIIETDPSEPHAANGLLVGRTLLYPEAFPKTMERLRARGIRVRTIDLSELAKAEGAVTCCSIVF